MVSTQDQALNTNSVHKNISHKVDSNKCRLCGKEVENYTNIISAWGTSAQKEYKRCNDKVASHLLLVPM